MYIFYMKLHMNSIVNYFVVEMSELVQTAHLAGSLDPDTDSGASNADSPTAPAANYRRYRKG